MYVRANNDKNRALPLILANAMSGVRLVHTQKDTYRAYMHGLMAAAEFVDSHDKYWTHYLYIITYVPAAASITMVFGAPLLNHVLKLRHPHGVWGSIIASCPKAQASPWCLGLHYCITS